MLIIAGGFGYWLLNNRLEHQKEINAELQRQLDERKVEIQEHLDELRNLKKDNAELQRQLDERTNQIASLPIQAGSSEERIDENMLAPILHDLRDKSLPSDITSLRLNTHLNLYSYTQFYWNVALNDPVRYHQALNDLFEQGKISFPHNLCMELVVMTNDDKILLSLRSPDVGTFPNTWSCSIEENLKPHEDMKGDRRTTVARWMGRALSEELGVKSDYCKEMTVLSVFLEGTTRLNISMAGYVALDLNQEELSQIIAMYLQPDEGEHKRYDYLTLKEMATELKSPSRPYHPTSRYRMLMALLHIYGEANFAKQYMGLLSPIKATKRR